MEDHVGRVLSAVAATREPRLLRALAAFTALAAAGGSVAALVRALAPLPESEAWAALALLLAVLSLSFSLSARRAPRPWRAVAAAAAAVGLLVALLVLAPVVREVALAFLQRGPGTSL